MRWQLTVGLAMVVLAGVSAAQDDASSADKQKLQGTWKLVAGEAMGKPIPPELLDKGIKLVIQGNTSSMTGPQGKEEKGSFKLNATKKPRHIDLLPPKEGKQRPTIKGIYEINGDTLRICFVPPMPRKGDDGQPVFEDMPRATTFNGEKAVLFTFKRQKTE